MITYNHLTLYSILLDIWTEQLHLYTEVHQFDWLKIKIYAILSKIDSLDIPEAKHLKEAYLNLYKRLDSS